MVQWRACEDDQGTRTSVLGGTSEGTVSVRRNNWEGTITVSI